MDKKASLFRGINVIILISFIGFSSNYISTSTTPFENTSSVMKTDELENLTEPSTLPSELVFCGTFPIVSRPVSGPDRRDAFYIAVDEINAQTGAERILPDGVNIKAIAFDDGNDVTGGVIAAQNCINQGANIVIGSSSSTVSAAIQEELKNIPIMQISYASSSPTLSNRTEYPYFMRVIGSDDDQGLAIVDLVDSLGFTKGAIIHQDDLWGVGTPMAFSANWSGNITTTQLFNVGAIDVSSQVQNLKDAVNNEGAQFILLNAFPTETATVIKEAFNVGLTNNENVTFIITDGGTASATFSSDNDVKTGMQNVLGVIPNFIGPKYQTFLDRWNTVTTCSNSTGDIQITCGFARKTDIFDYFAPLAYDATYVAAKGFANALASNPAFSATPAEIDELRNSLYSIIHEGAGPRIEFNLLGEVRNNYNLVSLINDTFEPIGKWDGKLVYTNDSMLLPGGSSWFLTGNLAVGTKPHSPIVVNSNYEFALNNFSGSGTVDNPYFLRGYNISSTSNHLIEIVNTSAHFIISNFLLDGLNLTFSNVYLYNVSNGIIRNNFVINSTSRGVESQKSSNNSFLKNIVNTNTTGIYLNDNSSNNTIIKNSISVTYTGWASIHIGANSNENYVAENTVNVGGIFSGNSNKNVFSGNYIENSVASGISINFGDDTKVLKNIIIGSGIGWAGMFIKGVNNEISFNQITKAGNWGLFIKDSLSTSILENTIYDSNGPGIGMANTNSSFVSNNSIFNCTDSGIQLEFDSNNNIIELNIIYNTSSGINLGGFNHNISFNTIYNTNAIGIFTLANNSGNHLLTGNEIYNNSELGILIEGANHNRVIDNKIYDNGEQGIGIGDWGFGGITLNNTLIRNKIYNNTDTGIKLQLANNNLITDNRIYGNIRGVSLRYTNESEISNNEIYDNTFSGIATIFSNSSSIYSNRIYRNNIGIGADSSKDTIILSNDVSDNEAQGIWISNSLNFTISNNTIYGNLDNEIEFVNTNSSKVKFNDIAGVVNDGGLNNIFSNNHWAGWLSSNPYNQDPNPRPVPYHMSEPSLVSPSSGSSITDEVMVQWSFGNDFLNHPLTYTILYSTNNGVSWQVATSGLTTTSFLWDVSGFANETILDIKVHEVDNIGFEASSNIISFNIFRHVESSTTSMTATLTTNPSDSSSKPENSSSDTVPTTPSLEVIILLISLFAVLLIRRKKNKFN